MNNIAILDTYFGDTGKGRCAHFFSAKADWIVRHGGSNNCGHVIYRNNKKYNHHFLPSTDYRNKELKSFLASGMYLHLPALLNEIKEATADFPHAASTIYIDPDAYVITDKHIEDDRNHNSHLGTTGKGVGFAASDKYKRTGIHVYDFINDNADIITALKSVGVKFAPLLALKEIFEKSNIVFEGHQGVMLDINAGIFPYVTSSDCTVSGIYAAGFNFIKLNRVYGLIKGGYGTKSGEGPLPTEIIGEEADKLRKLGGEIGNTTGRNRRIAYMDLPMLKYGINKGGITHLIMTKLDIMNGQEKIKVCYDYGKCLFSPNDFKELKPHYIELPGWKNSKNLEEVAPFIKAVEDFTGLKVEYISTGVNDNDMIQLSNEQKPTNTSNIDNLINPFDD